MEHTIKICIGKYKIIAVLTFHETIRFSIILYNIFFVFWRRCYVLSIRVYYISYKLYRRPILANANLPVVAVIFYSVVFS